MCPPVSPCKGASVVKFPAYNACILGMETPLRGRSGGHAGTAPTVSFGWITRGWLISFVWIVREWLFCLCGMCGKILRSVVGAVPVCPPASPHRGASIVQFPTHNTCIFGMETPLRGRSGGHAGIAPTVSFGWIACVVLFVGENGAHEPTPSVLYFCQPRVD